MSIPERSLLRLPSRAIGPVRLQIPPEGEGSRANYVPMESQTWAGRPIGLLADQRRYPILWTLGSLARMQASDEGVLRSDGVSVVAAPTGKQCLRRPRAVIYQPITVSTYLGRQACVGLAEELTERKILAAALPNFSDSNSETADFLRVIIPPSDAELLEDVNAYGSTERRFRPIASAADWAGGEVLYLLEIGAASGAYPYSSADFDQAGGDLQSSFPGRASEALAQHQAFAPAYDRLRVHAVVYSTYAEFVGNEAQVAVAGNHNRSALASAAAGVGTVTYEDVGDFSTTEDAFAAVIASMRQAIRDFFGLP